MGGPAGRHADHPHPHPCFPHTGHDSPGGLVQQEERYPGLAVEGDGIGWRGARGGLSLRSQTILYKRLLRGFWRLLQLVKLPPTWCYKPHKPPVDVWKVVPGCTKSYFLVLIYYHHFSYF